MKKTAAEQVMIRLNKDKKNKTLLLPKESTIAALYKRTRQNLGNIGQGVGMMLYFGGEALDEASQKTLKSCGIDTGNSIEIVLLANGGIRCLQPLPGYIGVTDEPCCIYGEADPTVKQAKMPCGCVIGVEAMKDHCTAQVEDSRFLFTCPSCGSSMKYFLVRHVLSVAMTDDELQSFNQKVDANYINSCLEIQRCPGCSIPIQRDPSKTFRNPNWVKCQACSAQNGKPFEFCWVCLKPWKGDAICCGNENCNGKDPRIQIIETCAAKTIGSVCDVPSIRCCAKCGYLIEHKDRCKHMNCPQCHYAFCFVCLKPQTSEKTWQCGSFDSKCNAAPRQTNIFDIEKENAVESSRATVQVSHRADYTFGEEWWSDFHWDFPQRPQGFRERRRQLIPAQSATVARGTQTSSRTLRSLIPAPSTYGNLVTQASSGAHLREITEVPVPVALVTQTSSRTRPRDTTEASTPDAQATQPSIKARLGSLAKFLHLRKRSNKVF